MDLSEEAVRRIITRVLQKRSNDARPEALFDFATNRIRLRGRPFGFTRHRYLEQIYRDRADRTVFMKAAQVGLSTYHLIKALHLAVEGYKTIYFLPTADQARAFGRERFQPIVAGSGFGGSASGPADRVTFADGAVLFHGLRTDAGVRSIDADFIVMDELDASPPDRVVLATDRVLHSELAWASYLSTPTYPGTGVAKLFEQSDQRHWLVCCSGCRFDFDPGDHFPDCIGEQGGVYSRVCPRCGRPFDPSTGRWVAAYPSNRELRGYHVSHLTTTLPASEIMRQFREAERPHERRRFYNSVLGVPYHDTSSRLSPEELDLNVGSYSAETAAEGALMGVDVGDTIHVVVGSSEEPGFRVIYASELNRLDELDGLMERFGAAACVIDAMPYKASASDFARRHPGRVWIAYLGSGRFSVSEEYQPSGPVRRVTLDRSSALDELVTSLRSRRITFPTREDPAIDRLLEHLSNLYRMVMDSPIGGRRAVWHSSGPDHYALALLFAVTAGRLAPTSYGVPVARGKRRIGRNADE